MEGDRQGRSSTGNESMLRSGVASQTQVDLAPQQLLVLYDGT